MPEPYDLPTLDALADRLLPADHSETHVVLPAESITRTYRLRAPVWGDGEIARPGLYVEAEIVGVGVGWIDCRTADGIERHWIHDSDGAWLLTDVDAVYLAAPEYVARFPCGAVALDGATLTHVVLPAESITRTYRLRAPVWGDGEIARPGLYVEAEIVGVGVGWIDCRTADGIERHWIHDSDGAWLLTDVDAVYLAALEYVARFPCGAVALDGATLTAAHADLRRRLDGAATVGGLSSTLTGGSTEVTADGQQFTVSIYRADLAPISTTSQEEPS